jgi:hypothetical protein
MSIRKNHKADLHCEVFEGRLVPCIMPGVTPAVYAAMQAEVQHVLNLVPNSSVTDEATKSGNYSDASIWSAGHVPTAQDNVLIDSGVSVLINNTSAKANTLRVDGKLSFSQTTDSLLTADTIVVNAGGDFEMVSPNPAVHTGLTFSDNGPINRVWDPYGLSRQLIGIGLMDQTGNMYSSATVDIVGAQKTGWESIAGVARGTTSITLPTAPTGWQVGDTLLFNGTDSSAHDEKGVISSINGKVLTLAAPLQFDHLTPTGHGSALLTTVADLTRNVVFQSAATNSAEYGATMFMHTSGGTNDGITNQWGTPEAVTVDYAAFINMGRTDKSKPINDSVVVNGVLQAGTGTNPRARYAVHFHRDFNYDPGCTVQVVGDVVIGGPGWGYDNHSSNVNIQDCIATGVYGSSFNAEVGNELGSFTHDLAVTETSPNIGNNTNNDNSPIGDFGRFGDGFWFQGTYGIHVTGNVATGAPDAGFIYFGQSLKQGAIPSNLPAVANGLTIIPASLLPNGSTVSDTSKLPITEFNNNTVINANNGVELKWLGINSFPHPVQNNIDNFAAWNINNTAVMINYSLDVYVHNPILLASANPTFSSIGISNNGGYTANVESWNVDIEGFSFGVNTAGKGVAGVHGGFLNNLKANLYIGGVDGHIHVTTIDGNLTFGNYAETHGGVDFFVDPPSPGNAGNGAGVVPQGKFRSSQIYLNTPDHPNSELFYAESGYNVNPFTTANFTADQLALIPADIKALTNGQMMSKYGLTFEGAVAGPDAVALAYSSAGANHNAPSLGTPMLIGNVQPQKPLWLGVPNSTVPWFAVTNKLTGYVPTTNPFTDQNGTIHQPISFAPVNLHQGYNFIPEVVEGQLYSEIIYADTIPPVVALAPNQILTASLLNPPTAFAIQYLVTDASTGAQPKAHTINVNLAILPIQTAANGSKFVSVTIKATDIAGNATLFSFNVALV